MIGFFLFASYFGRAAIFTRSWWENFKLDFRFLRFTSTSLCLVDICSYSRKWCASQKA